MEAVIREMKERSVVGVGDRFISILSPDKTSDRVIPGLWETFGKREGDITGTTSGVYLGVCTEPSKETPRTRDDEFFYIAGAEVDSLDDVPEGMIGMTIPAGRYAVFVHKGKLDTLGETMRHVHGDGLRDSGCTYRSGAPEIELYDQRFNPESDESEMEVWVPVM